MLARLLAAGVVLTALAIAWQGTLVDLLLPLYSRWLELADSSFRTVRLALVQDHGEWVILRLATPSSVAVLGEVVIAPDARTVLSSQAAAGIALQPFILGLALLFAWPLRKVQGDSRKAIVESALRITLGPSLLVVVSLLDVPMMLAGFAWYEEVRRFEPGRFSPLIQWADAMNAGGRFVMTAVAVALAVAAARRLAHRAADGGG